MICPKCKSKLAKAGPCPKCAPAGTRRRAAPAPAKKPPVVLIAVLAVIGLGIATVAVLSMRAKAQGEELLKESEKRLAEMKKEAPKPPAPVPLKVFDRDFFIPAGQGDGGAFVSKVAGRYRVEVKGTFGVVKAAVIPVQSEQKLTPAEEKALAAGLREIASGATEVWEGDVEANQKYMIGLAFWQAGNPEKAASKIIGQAGDGPMAKAHVTATVTAK